MNAKEKKEIGLNMTMLMQVIMNKDCNSEDVSNHAIYFARDMLLKFPEIREFVEVMFQDDWDESVAWIKWEEEMLTKRR